MTQIDFTVGAKEKAAEWLQRQWLVTNGLGGYAFGTIAGEITWRYQGLLVAALPGPHGRTVMLSDLAECLCLDDGRTAALNAPFPRSGLEEFALEYHLPRWRFRIGPAVVEKRVFMPHGQNTTHVRYTLLAAGPTPCRLLLHPWMNFRMFEGHVGTVAPDDYEVRLQGKRCEIHHRGGFPPLRFTLGEGDSVFVGHGGEARSVFYPHDAERGCPADGQLWSPGRFEVTLAAGKSVVLTATTEEWHVLEGFGAEEALAAEMDRRRRLLRIAAPGLREGLGASLVLSADQFLFTPAGRTADAAHARAEGDEPRSIVAGYPWFGDWGRDTMVSLEGLALVTGRQQEARWILRAFARHIRDGLIPNLFPEGRNEGLYHTADATLWFFHALDRYVSASGDRDTLKVLLPALQDILAHHRAGTRFGIGVDPADGLLRQGAAGFQLTWMDAKVGDWVVTPRRGKAVEINALWYNALVLLGGWLEGGEAEEVRRLAEQARASFNRRFWNEGRQCLFDVVDGEDGGDDPALRPNQIFAVSLPHPVLERERWAPVVNAVEGALLTPVGLRSLSRDHPDYKPKYTGDLRSRDAAYHQGTVWPWLIGPFIDAWLKIHPGREAETPKMIEALGWGLDQACIGTIGEIFDAEPPYAPRGCVAQAWSVAEVLRILHRAG